MHPRCLLDTDILSMLMRKDASVTRYARAYLEEYDRLTLSLITRFEILRGLHAKAAETQIAAFDAFCAQSEVLPMTDPVVVRAATVYADLYQAGRLISDADILIAATAMEHGLILISNNRNDFQRVRGLQLENWYDQKGSHK